ncbi:MAG: histone deacetylase [Verrucomicrobiota bacterium]
MSGKYEMVGLLLDGVYEGHETGVGHPECPERYGAVRGKLEAMGLVGEMGKVEVREATREEIVRCHHEDYFDLAKAEIEAGNGMLSTGDTNVSPRSYEVAMRASGGVVNAVDMVMEGELERAFCAVRPPGHHATPDRGMGFCVFNHIAVGARHAQAAHGIERVAIVDWDVHHGNGTQDIFVEDESVFFFSTHQSPWYPGTGAASERGRGKGEGTILNAPFPAGTGMESIGEAFREGFGRAMETFRPELVMISAGFDSRLGDPLGQFRLGDEDFVELTKVVMGVAEAYGEGRVVSMLEGGYDLEGLGSAVGAHVGALCVG